MTIDIETRKCSIDTVAVTIQALHVSGKQMTLAVFNQLPSCNLFDDDGNAASGVRLWGMVRYKGKSIVAEKNGVLYRQDIPSFLASRDLPLMVSNLAAMKAVERGEKDPRYVPIPGYTVSDRMVILRRQIRDLAACCAADTLPQLFIAV